MQATDADFNASSRIIYFKFDIYFNGATGTPLEVTRDNYLITASLLEETTANGQDVPFGHPTANEMDIELLNENGIFCPTNADSPYYGRIKRGVLVKAYMAINEADWISLGEFYVTSWQATITGQTASVTIADDLYNVLNLHAARPNVLVNATYKQAYANLLAALSREASIDPALTYTMLYAYYTGSNSDMLSALGLAACADCYCGRDGSIVVKPAWGTRELRATITDDDQIISASTEQSSSTDYDGVTVTYNVPQLVRSEILSIEDYSAAPGITEYPTVALTAEPLARLANIKVAGSAYVYVPNASATSATMAFSIMNTKAEATTVSIKATGDILSTTSHAVTDIGDSLLSVDSMYVQSSAYALRIKAFLKAYAESLQPIVTVEVRGNPLLLLRDKIRVVSNKYKLDFTGIIIRSELTYDGSLKGKLTLVDARVLEAVL